MAKKQDYGNDSISMLKGADRVRKRPAVIFGSDGLDGCEHSIFEVISNSIDEAREGYGNKIIITHFRNNEIEVEDFGRGCPVDYNNNEKRYNWELVYCELYAGGKYDTSAESYEYSLGLNGLGLCSTQFSSEFMDVEVIRDGFKYDLHFEKGNNVGGLKKEPCKRKQTGTKTRWRPDLEVFTDIDVSDEDIQKAYEIAKLTPTACNRQTCKVYVFKDNATKKQILENQLGGQGWAGNAPVMFVVTSDVSRFSGTYEHVQAYIDGGLFAMNFVWGLHLYHIASCFKMFVNEHKRMAEFHKLCDIPNNEVPIVLILAGYYKDEEILCPMSHRFGSQIIFKD